MEGQTKNTIVNHDFSNGLGSWYPNNCVAFASDASKYDKRIKAESGNQFAVIANRTQCWQGLEHDVTDRISPNVKYHVTAVVRVRGSAAGTERVQATLKLEESNGPPTFTYITSTVASEEKWTKLEGEFVLDNLPKKAIFYLEGPSAGTDLLVDRVNIFSTHERKAFACFQDGEEDIIQNLQFEDGLNHWTGRFCKIFLHDAAKGDNLPTGGQHYAIATERTYTWNGIQQEVTGRIQRKSAYEVMAFIKIAGKVASAQVLATLWVQTKDHREQYISIGKVEAFPKQWAQLQGRFLLNSEADKAVIYLEGPAPAIDILVASLTMRPLKKQPPSPAYVIENHDYGTNILENSDLLDGLKGWFSLGSCIINVADGSPQIIPPTARDSIGCKRALSGKYIHTTNRTQTWHGPAQMITDKLKLFLTYQISAWVRVSPIGCGTQNVNVAISVDDQWINGGEVEADEHLWKEVAASFRVEKKPSKVMVYVQGPAAGTDLMVAGLQIFPVDREVRFKHLKKQIEKLRTREVVVKISGAHWRKWCLPVKVTQVCSSFPWGSCINRSSLDNEDIMAFFVQNFNWAVFGNEMKWPWIEPQRGQFNYRDCDELLEFCNSHNIKVRGHCIFWEVIYYVQHWVKDLNPNDLRAAIQKRLCDLCLKYRGKFQHYDVNNEMMHGSFYRERLGKEIWAYMFKTAHELDPSATLFVNDYHVEDGNDAKSSPERYIAQIAELQEHGAPVRGIGIQGHISYPVGTIVRSALDKLASLGLPIWFTELDVMSSNEYVRADDLEVMLREAFAHPSVEGIMLWGFWDLMSREQAQLVEVDGTLNEAGKRFIALKNEWSTNVCGHTDLEGYYRFHAFHGTYEVEVSTFSETTKQKFTVDKGVCPLVIEINL